MSLFGIVNFIFVITPFGSRIFIDVGVIFLAKRFYILTLFF